MRDSFKTKMLCTLCLGLIYLSFCRPVCGQPFSLNWYKIAGGGTNGTGGTLSLTGTIGQPDAGGPLTGGSYSLMGGFWAFEGTVATQGPTLYIVRSGALVIVYWQDTPGWTLQQTPSLNPPASWSPSLGVTTSNGTNYLTLASPLGNEFYRLVHQ